MAYNPHKAAQLIAAFILKNGGRPVSVLKLMKLIYLADRESIRTSALPILDEPRFSYPRGPLNGFTYNFLKGRGRPRSEYKDWHKFIAKPKGELVSLARADLSDDDLDELSLSDEECIKTIWALHGGKSDEELAEWTHKPNNIPEWKYPKYGKELPIEFRDIVYALKLDNADAVIKQYDELLAIDDSLDRLGIRHCQ